MHFQTLLYLAVAQAWIGSALSSHPHAKRAGQTDTTLYAYSSSTDSWPIAYNTQNGLLYVAEDPTNSSAGLVQTTWDIASVSSSYQYANASYLNGTAIGSLYADIDSDSNVGVLPLNSVAALNETAVGFVLFGTQLVYNSNSSLKAQFWAQPTTSTGFYSLRWITDGKIVNGSFPVVIKASTSSTSTTSSATNTAT